jgi:type IX secretion system PorP/SprF family membrane protein
MKKAIATLAIILLGFIMASAQQIPLYSQYYFNRMVFNPAYTGENNGTEAYLMGRRQWTGLNGYETKGLSISGAPQDKNIGLGLHYINDVNSILNTNSIYGNYSYNIKFSDENQLRFGLSLGVIDSRYDLSNVIVNNTDDPVLRFLNSKGGAVMDGAIGAVAKFSNFHMGVSVLQLFNSEESFADNVGNEVRLSYKPHYILSTGIKIPIGESMDLEPLLMYRGVSNAPGQFDVNLMLNWTGKGWLGLAYRDDYAMSIMTGLNLADRVKVGYNYDWSISEYSAALGGTHEFMLGFRLDKKQEGPKPRPESDAKIEKLENQLSKLKDRKVQKDTVVLVQKVIEKQIVVKEVKSENPGIKPKTERAPKVEKADNGDRPMYLLVVGSFTESVNAAAYNKQLKAKGLSSDVFYNEANKTHYVHLGQYKDKEAARSDIKGKFKGQSIWVKTIE